MPAPPPATPGRRPARSNVAPPAPAPAGQSTTAAAAGTLGPGVMLGVPSLAARLAHQMGVRDYTTARQDPTLASLSSQALKTGQKYQIERELGVGGMGTVFALRDNDTLRMVAMKALGRSTQRDPEWLQRFVHEAQVSAQLEHPNIIPVYELGCSAAGQLYFTMKQVPGRSLRDVLDELRAHRSPDDLAGRIRVLVNVTNAIAYAHDRGVIHRDLKPDNIMLGRFGEVLVMDWGLALLVGMAAPRPDVVSADASASGHRRLENVVRSTARGIGPNAICGTPSYMPPEQASGRPLTPAADIFALGAILHELLTLSPPYGGRTPQEALERAAVHAFIAPRRNKKYKARFKRMPRALNAVVVKACAKEPADRYPTVTAFADDLRAWLEDREVSVYRPSVAQRFMRAVGRGLAAVIPLLIFLAILGGALFITLQTMRLLQRDNGRLERELEQERSQRRALQQRLDNRPASPAD